jgi:hypothetical protein
MHSSVANGISPFWKPGRNVRTLHEQATISDRGTWQANMPEYMKQDDTNMYTPCPDTIANIAEGLHEK